MHENITQNSDIRLIDEALSSQPIKNTFRLGWEFIKLNQQFNISMIIIFIVLELFATIPKFSLLFTLLSAVFSLLIQIYVGKIFYKSRDIKEYIDAIEDSTIDKLLKKDIGTAFGAYLGWMVLTIFLILLFGFIGRSLGIINLYMSQSDMVDILPIIAPIIIFITYIQFLVQANIILLNSFKEGFKEVFRLFSPSLWHLAFQSSYFKYVALLGLVIISSFLLFSFIIGIITAFSGLAIIGNILMVILIYIFMIIISIGFMMARRVVEF